MAQTRFTVSGVHSGTADILVLTHRSFQKQTTSPSNDVMFQATLRTRILLQPLKYTKRPTEI
jgi:hypothetical protein